MWRIGVLKKAKKKKRGRNEVFFGSPLGGEISYNNQARPLPKILTEIPSKFVGPGKIPNPSLWLFCYSCAWRIIQVMKSIVLSWHFVIEKFRFLLSSCRMLFMRKSHLIYSGLEFCESTFNIVISFL